MDIEKAIEWIKAISATQSESIHKNSLSERKEALYIAIKALEKQKHIECMLEKAEEEIENVYGRETELSEEIRDFLNDMN